MATQFYVRDEVPVALTKGPSLLDMREKYLWETQASVSAMLNSAAEIAQQAEDEAFKLIDREFDALIREIKDVDFLEDVIDTLTF